MYVNCHFDKKYSKIHLWEYIGDKREYSELDWVPYIFMQTSEREADCRTIDGKPAKRVDFRKWNDYKEFCESHPDTYENNVKPEIQFLCERFSKIPDDEIEPPVPLVYFIDIEEKYENGGWSKAEDAKNEIALISVFNNRTKHTTTWGIKPYTGTELRGDKHFTYKQFGNEKLMLLDFIKFAHKYYPDVWSGWNVYKFDFVYIINRICRVLSDAHAKKLSPLGMAHWWTGKDGKMSFDIPGTAVMDYMELYKIFKRKMLESYKLSFVLQYEKLESVKLDYQAEGYATLADLHEDHNRFVEYNVQDVRPLDLLDQKLMYIRTAQALTLYAKCPPKMYAANTQLNEGVLLAYYRRNGLCAPHFGKAHPEKFIAGYVKTPQLGMYEYVVDLDIASSYPHQMILCNMSTETYYGKIVSMTEDAIVEAMQKQEFPSFKLVRGQSATMIEGAKLTAFNRAVKSRMFSIAPIGTVFWAPIGDKKIGVLSEVQRLGFEKRKIVKKKMIKAKAEATDLKGDEKKAKLTEMKQFHALQYAIKVVLNSLYGATAAAYSRYCNSHISEAITSCGRHCVKQGAVYANELLNDPNSELKALMDEIRVS